MVQFPEGVLPLPQAEYSDKPVTNTATTTMSSGRPRRRRLGHGIYLAAKLSWQLDPAEKDLFLGWWEHTLDLGTAPFSIELATGSLVGPHVVQMVDEPESSLSGYFWRVTCSAVILSKPRLDAASVGALIGSGIPLDSFLNGEDSFDFHVNTQLPGIALP